MLLTKEKGPGPDKGPAEPDSAVWRAIRDFALDDPGATMPFTARLARDHLWTADYAGQVVLEYRRFLYLAVTGQGMATPSEDVDAAWHLHLAYSRSYWDGLCGAVLKRPLHHDPTGGAEDGAAFRQAYAATLARYRDVFGAAAPTDIWPDVERRFDTAAGFRTVPLEDFHLVGRIWPIDRDRQAVWALVALLGGNAALLALAGVRGWWFWGLLGLFAALVVHLGLRVHQRVALPILSGPGGSMHKYVVSKTGDGAGGCGGCGGCGGYGGCGG